MLNNTYSIVFLTVCESGSNTENYTLESFVCLKYPLSDLCDSFSLTGVL